MDTRFSAVLQDGVGAAAELLGFIVDVIVTGRGGPLAVWGLQMASLALRSGGSVIAQQPELLRLVQIELFAVLFEVRVLRVQRIGLRGAAVGCWSLMVQATSV
jgi:hypothetical protein